MACGGFTCSKNALAALNVLYIMVAFILIGVAGYARVVGVFTDIKIMGGIIACGVFLLLIAIVGLIGAVKHHQVLLFFYMIILFLLFLMQFSIACACLAMNDEQRESLAKQGWRLADTTLLNTTQPPSLNDTHVQCPCEPCLNKIKEPMKEATKVAGGIGLFFSFTEIVGVWLALRFRNQKDPRANPSAFL
ncbi:hypothetical protein LSH36_241g07013 [Paralvinella palmiformis]|uniref:Tetraspanin-31 n=1 Tax=Paralvinella palmiformis TaxID=53620 RepID=A0AAD9N354_9ANNE|nr:hypothetical protein LSH36_241g07013 [Paralvinella palmiformis]